MKYSVDSWIFDRIPDAYFGIVIGCGLKNSATEKLDASCLEEAEADLRARHVIEDIKTHPDFMVYRDALQKVSINPNKFSHSVEAMGKRVLKGDNLPRINALVDRCNAISLNQLVSLGGHDLRDIDADLEVRISVMGDRFRPFGSEAFEAVDPGELVFTSGNTVQTRQWLWRQSELGKMTLNSSDIFFQLVGFYGDHQSRIETAMDELEKLIKERFGGTSERYVVNREQREIEF